MIIIYWYIYMQFYGWEFFWQNVDMRSEFPLVFLVAVCQYMNSDGQFFERVLINRLSTGKLFVVDMVFVRIFLVPHSFHGAEVSSWIWGDSILCSSNWWYMDDWNEQFPEFKNKRPLLSKVKMSGHADFLIRSPFIIAFHCKISNCLMAFHPRPIRANRKRQGGVPTPKWPRFIPRNSTKAGLSNR